MPLQHSRLRLHLPRCAVALVPARDTGNMQAASNGQGAAAADAERFLRTDTGATLIAAERLARRLP